MKKKLFIIVNVDWFFLSHRLPIALEAKQKGFDVTILAGDTGKGDEIRKNGLKFIKIPLQRSGLNPFMELRTFIYIFKLILKNKPDVVHNVALKTCLYGGGATRFLKNTITVNAVSGLGFAFTTDKITFKQILLSKLIKFGFHKNVKTIFQNPDDLDMFRKLGILNEKSKTVLIKGSGVDIDNKYKYRPLKVSTYINVLFPARLLYTKGVKEFCYAAKIVNKHVENVNFFLAGDIDNENKSAINKDTILKWEKECGVKWIGHRDDMVRQYENSDFVVLPSFREGLPKSLIEACAIGRPVITTDTPGCRECVINNQNGFLVPVKDVNILAEKIILLCNDYKLREKMGKESRMLAEKEFSIKTVVEKTLSLYK